MTPLSQWPASERPRERLLSLGPEGMTETELLALVLGCSSSGSGGVLETARRLLHHMDGLAGLTNCGPGELMKIPGIGVARASALCATVELSRRLAASPLLRGAPIRDAEDVYKIVRGHLSGRGQEIFLALALDARHRVLVLREVARGSATGVEVHPREVFAPAVREGGAAVLVAHNHPSGDPEPSDEDAALTVRLGRAGEVLGIPLLDHIVVGTGSYVSLAERGVI
jgi:DNA repair protein RadC